jgi:hypothetical protein
MRRIIVLFYLLFSTALAPLEDEDVYRTAGIDEVEIEIKDLVRLQKANARNGDPYDDILSSNNMSARRHITPRLSSVSSSSTLNNLIPSNGQQNSNNRVAGEEKQEETVTETIQTQQIQTMFRQIGQNMDDSAFFIPLTSSTTHHDGQAVDDGTIFIPVSSASIRQDEQPALHDHRDR